MDRGWVFRLVMVVAMLALSLYVLYPSFVFYTTATPEQREKNDVFCRALPDWAPCKKFNLGLDLQGGLHLVMGVEVDKAVEHRTDRLADALREQMNEEGLKFARLDRPRNTSSIELQIAEETDMDEVEKYLRKNFSILEVTRRDGRRLVLAIVAPEADRLREDAVDQAIKTIRNRADRLGVSEPTIAKRGADSILIQLPGIRDPNRAIDNIGKTAQLEFQIVDEEASAVFDDVDVSPIGGATRKSDEVRRPNGSVVREVFFEVPVSQKAAIRALLEPKLPSNLEIGFGSAATQTGNPIPDLVRTYVLEAKPGITGDYLDDARVQQDPNLPSQYWVGMDFDSKGAKIFSDLTEANVGRRMAIVLDDTVNSAPVIQEKIGGGSARITLGASANARNAFQEAKDLADVLKGGALPAPVEVREQRTVGQTLGEETVEAGKKAFVLGTLLIFLFMALWYRWSGVLADVALVLNVLMVMAALALFEATLTLPGIAGLVLMMGMAVDSNVLIFERIREELRIGKTPRAAIEAGYDKAWGTIFDSNITTLIAAVVLMQYGSGPVKGFAVTLIIGLGASMFTAIVVTRLVYDFIASRRRLQSLSI